MTGEVVFGAEFSRLIPLWKEAFGDSDEFLALFEREGYSAERMACIIEDGEPISALYWFDCEYLGKKLAYLYAIATKKNRRGEGLCSRLMKAVHEHLSKLGYSGCLLSPASDNLFSFYEKLGYKKCCFIDEFEAEKCDSATEVNRISAKEFAKTRRSILDERAVIQEGACINFLATQADFYKGDTFLLTARREGERLFALEFLGDVSLSGSILNSLGFSKGVFRTPGTKRAICMYLPLTIPALDAPKYFAFTFE